MAKSNEASIPSFSAEIPVFASGDGAQRVDRCLRLLANRRRRFCLYYLLQADAPLLVVDLARLIEASLSPAGSTVSERQVEEAVGRLVDTHLVKLSDAGLVEVSHGHVELVSSPPVPIRGWLTPTAAFELDFMATWGSRARD